AETPVVCGVAIDVPLIVFVAVLLEYQSEVMFTPGPKMSTHVPKFENDARVSVLSVAATVIAAATRAGEVVQASVLLLPAAMQNVTPELIAPLTASSRAWEAPPPSDMLATAGWMEFCATQLTPAMTPEFVPEPLQLRTRTATRATPFATPYVAPPVVPETCVPWPLQSCPFWPSPIAS